MATSFEDLDGRNTSSIVSPTKATTVVTTSKDIESTKPVLCKPERRVLTEYKTLLRCLMTDEILETTILQALIRKVRLSRKITHGLLDFLAQPANTSTDSEGADTLITDVKTCNLLLKDVYDQLARSSFDFLGLPREIRDMIYGLVVGHPRNIHPLAMRVFLYIRRAEGYAQTCQECGANCMKAQCNTNRLDLALMFCNTRTHKELSEMLFDRCTPEYFCLCEFSKWSMGQMTRNLKLLFCTKLIITMQGKDRDGPMSGMIHFRKLKELHLILSLMTRLQLIREEILKKRFFPGRLPPAWVDTFGMQALTTIRDLDTFTISKAPGFTPPADDERELEALQAYFTSKLVKPRVKAA